MARVVTSGGCVIVEPEVLDGLGVNWEGYEAPLSANRMELSAQMRATFSRLVDETTRAMKEAESKMEELVAVKKHVSDLRVSAAALSKPENEEFLPSDVLPMLRRFSTLDAGFDEKIERYKRQRDDADVAIVSYTKLLAFFDLDYEFDKVLHGLHTVQPKFKNKVYREAKRMLSEVGGLQREVLFILESSGLQVPGILQFVKTCGDMYATIGEGFKIAKRRLAQEGTAFWERENYTLPKSVANAFAKISA